MSVAYTQALRLLLRHLPPVGLDKARADDFVKLREELLTIFKEVGMYLSCYPARSSRAPYRHALDLPGRAVFIIEPQSAKHQGSDGIYITLDDAWGEATCITEDLRFHPTERRLVGPFDDESFDFTSALTHVMSVILDIALSPEAEQAAK